MSSKFLLQLILVICFCTPVLLANETAEHLDSVLVSWSEHRSRPATVKIHFLTSNLPCKDQKLSVEEVQQLVDRFEFAPNEAFLMEFVRAFNPEVIERHRNHDQSTGPWELWRDVVYLDDGVSKRSQGKYNEHIVARGLHLMYSKHLSRQMTAYEKGRCMVYFYDRGWLLGIPPERVLEQIETAEVDSDVLRLSGEDVGEWVLDKQTHLPISQKSMDDNSSFGRLTYYRLPTVYPGEVTAPAIRLQVDIRDGIAHNAKVTAIVDAEFNLDIPRSAFVVPVPKGAVMVDERSDERHARRLKHDIDDAAEYFFANGVPQTDQVASSSGQSQKKFDWKAFFLIANGISLIVLGVVLWRRSGS